MGLTGKIGIYGRSLGGISTCHVTQMADFIIADRTFGNIKDLSCDKFYSSWTYSFWKLASCGWYTNNDKSFIAPQT
jgi:hypothetical protein